MQILIGVDSFGKHDKSFWENYINSEFSDLFLNLCGNNDYNSSHKEVKNDNNIGKIRDTVKYLLCDKKRRN